MAEFRELIFGIADIVRPRQIIEIGAESGAFSEELVKWCRNAGATLTTVDPTPQPRVKEMAAASPDVHKLVLEPSPAALAGLPSAEITIIDGDHNYYTVSSELAFLHDAAERSGVAPLFVLHDVAWPWARRDIYYQPAKLPPEHVHPHTFNLGVHIDSAEPIDGGFRNVNQYGAALHQGGPRNGVLTAVEDFVAAHKGYRLFRVPAVFGLGVVFADSHPKAAELTRLLAFYDENPLLARLEENRVRLTLRVLELHEDLGRIGGERERAERELQRLRGRWYAKLGSRLERLFGG